MDPVDFTRGQFGEHDLLKYVLMLTLPLFMERRMISHPISQLMLNAGKRVLEEAVAAPPPKKSKAEKKVVPSPRIEESSEDLDEEECG